MFRYFKDLFRNIKYGYRNLYVYVPVIWRDRDWDYSSMLSLWELKFKRMAHQHLVYGHHIGNERTARKLRVAAALCSRIREDDYCEWDRKQHDEKWGKPEMVFLDTNHNCSEMRFVRLNVRNDKDSALELEEFRRYMKHAEHQKSADIEYLTNMIRKDLLTWWD